MVSERFDPRQQMVWSDSVGWYIPSGIPNPFRSLAADRPSSFSGYGGAPVDRPYSFSGYGGAPADRPYSFFGYGGAPVDRPYSFSGYGGAPADRPYFLSGYGGGPNRSVVKVPGSTPGKTPNPSSDLGKMKKSVVRYEADASDSTAVWRILHLRPSEEPRNVPDQIQPAEVEMVTTRRIDELRRINLNSTQGIQPMRASEGNFSLPSTGVSVVVTGCGEDPLPCSSWASPTWNHQSPSLEPALVRQWPQNPKEHLSQSQFKARQWNSNPSYDRAPNFYKSVAKVPKLDSPEIDGGERLVEAVVQEKETTIKPFTPGVCKHCGYKWFSGHKCKQNQRVDLIASEIIVGPDCAGFNMKKGEVALVTIPPEDAIGFTELKQDLVVIPTNSTWILEVELVSFVKDLESVYALAMNDTGNLLVAGGIEQVVSVWDPGTGSKNMKWQNMDLITAARGNFLNEDSEHKKETPHKPLPPGIGKYCRVKWLWGHKCKHYQQVNLMVGVSGEIVSEQKERFNHPEYNYVAYRKGIGVVCNKRDGIGVAESFCIGQIGKEIMDELIAKGGIVKSVMEERGLVQIADPAAIEAMEKKNNICNISVIAHVDHGKSTLTDSLVAAAGIIVQEVAGDVSKTDTRVDEANRGITINFTGISLFYEMTEVSLMSYKGKVSGLDEKLLPPFVSDSRVVLNPMAAMFGGIVGQEIMRACSRKLHPNYQFLYFDSVEFIPVEPLESGDLKPENTRDAAQISVLGSKLRRKLEQEDFMGGAEIIVSPPVVSFRETVLEKSSCTVMSKFQNKHNRLYMESWPVEEGLAEAIDEGRIGPRDDLKVHSKILSEEFWWDKDLAKKNWGFGPETIGPKMVIDMCKRVQYLYDIKDSVVAGFQWASKEGTLVVVDCIEGVSMPTETVLRQALGGRIRSVLTVNKMDRCLFELQVEGLHGWAFTLYNFTKIYASKFGVDESKKMERLWGENYDDPTTKKWTIQHTGSITCKRGFVQFYYKPIKQIIKTCMNDQKDKLWSILRKLGVTLKTNEKELIGKALMKRVMQTWLPANNALLKMMIFHRSYPLKAQRNRVENLFEGPLDGICATAIRNCNMRGSLKLNVSEMVPASDKGRILAFGRVLSRKVVTGKKVRILVPDAVLGHKKYPYGKSVQHPDIWRGKTQESDEDVPCVNVVAMVGLDQFITKKEALTNEKAYSGKFHSHYQFFYFDSFQKRRRDANVFVVGSGTLGCEFLKNLALMRVSCSHKGTLILIHEDFIAKSIWSRQYLCRDWNIGLAKSTVAAAAACATNSCLHTDTLQNRACPETEYVFPMHSGKPLILSLMHLITSRLGCIWYYLGFLISILEDKYVARGGHCQNQPSWSI